MLIPDPEYLPQLLLRMLSLFTSNSDSSHLWGPHFPLILLWDTSYVFVYFSHQVISNALWPPWTVPHQAPLSIGFSKQEYWSGLPFPSPGDLPNPGIEPASSALQADSLALSHLGSPTSYINCPKPDCEFIISQKFSWFLVPTSRLLNKAVPSELSKEKSNRTSTVCRS